jgi:hypothetical protein
LTLSKKFRFNSHLTESLPGGGTAYEKFENDFTQHSFFPYGYRYDSGIHIFPAKEFTEYRL